MKPRRVPWTLLILAAGLLVFAAVRASQSLYAHSEVIRTVRALSYKAVTFPTAAERYVEQARWAAVAGLGLAVAALVVALLLRAVAAPAIVVVCLLAPVAVVTWDYTNRMQTELTSYRTEGYLDHHPAPRPGVSTQGWE